tara:strand:- start:24 stop:230 length:207 start_codon:yes stop_codon:yes gene_type:complete
MNWKDILKNDASNFIRLAQDSMDKFDEEEKKLIRFYINSLENKYDKDTLEALKFELKKKDLLHAKGRF